MVRLIVLGFLHFGQGKARGGYSARRTALCFPTAPWSLSATICRWCLTGLTYAMRLVRKECCRFHCE